MAGQWRVWDPEPRPEGLAWGGRRDRRKGTWTQDVMVAGGRQGAKGAPPHLKSSWDISGQTRPRVRGPERFGDGGEWLELLLWGMSERTQEGDGKDGRSLVESLLGAGDHTLVVAPI